MATNDSLMHSFSTGKSLSKGVIAFFVFIIFLGIGTGYLFAKNNSTSSSGSTSMNPFQQGAAKGKVFGSDDLKTYKDVAEGTLKAGGVEGEGQFHLERPGGESQNVYMTSATVDLSQFINKKIKVWGQTQTAKTAGWLMDVGRVEVL